MKRFNTKDWNESSNDESLGFSFSLPKIKIKAPKIKIAPIKVSIKKVIPKITVDTKHPLKTISHAAGDYLRIVNPINIVKSYMSATPFTKNIFNQTDKILGGTISSIQRVTNLPSKILDGKGVSKAEIMEAVVMAAKVAAIIASGGSAAAFISAGAGAMKNGPLGQSAFGRNILTGVELAAGGVAVKDIIEKQAETVAAKEIQNKTGIPIALLQSAYGTSQSSNSIADFSKTMAKKVSEEQLKKAGLGNTATQAILSGNAAALGVAISDAPNLLMDKAKREALALKIKVEKLASIEGLRSKAQQKADQALAEARDMDKLKDRIEAEKNELIKKELDSQFSKLVSSYSKNQKDALDMSLNAEIETAKTSVEIAAAEEGRYVAPINKLVIAGGVTASILAVYLYFKD